MEYTQSSDGKSTTKDKAPSQISHRREMGANRVKDFEQTCDGHGEVPTAVHRDCWSNDQILTDLISE